MTFDQIYSRTVAELRSYARKPLFIAETGVYAGPGMAARVRNLFAGAAAMHMVGIVYFERKGHSDWRIVENSSAVGVFQNQAARWLRRGTALHAAPEYLNNHDVRLLYEAVVGLRWL